MFDFLKQTLKNGLTSAVGNRLENNEDDVRTTKRRFQALGRLEESEEAIESGIITEPLTKAIKTFQREKGLKEDGLMFPKGETEQALRTEDLLQKKQMLSISDQRKEKSKLENQDAFNPNGLGHLGSFIIDPVDAIKAREIAIDSEKNARRQFPLSYNFQNDEADAFRHALWSYRMAKEFGEQKAKKFSDAHEREVRNPENERRMDIFNNRIGRELARNKNNYSLPDEEVVLKALKENRLKVVPDGISNNESFIQKDNLLNKRGLTVTGRLYNN